MVAPIMQPEMALFTICLIFFSGWLSFLTQRLAQALRVIEDSDQGVEEISQGLAQVVSLLQSLPEWLREEVKEYIPQFHINQQGPTWIEPLIQHWLGNVSNPGENVTFNSPADVARDTAGRFIEHATTPKED